jgi:hypothetical protein
MQNSVVTPRVSLPAPSHVTSALTVYTADAA